MLGLIIHLVTNEKAINKNTFKGKKSEKPKIKNKSKNEIMIVDHISKAVSNTRLILVATAVTQSIPATIKNVLANKISSMNNFYKIFVWLCLYGYPFEYPYLYC